MPDFKGEMISVPIELFRVAAPPLVSWHVEQPSLPCWRLWWNSGRGASVSWRGGTVKLAEDHFVLVAPETHFEARLDHRIARHLFIHFSLNSSRWALTDRVLSVPCRDAAQLLAQRLVELLPPMPERVIGEPLLAGSLTCSVLSMIGRDEWNAPPADARIRRVISAIETHPALPWPDAQLARLASLSVGGLLRLFRKETGESPQRLVLRLRLSKARSLLLHTELPLEEITEQCGFCDRSYFSTVFRREIGMPPAQYRRRNHARVSGF